MNRGVRFFAGCSKKHLALDAHDRGRGGVIPEICAFYFKSPPVPIEENEARKLIGQNWNGQMVAAAFEKDARRQ
jgi:myo-inositol-1-phosphate synthase